MAIDRIEAIEPKKPLNRKIWPSVLAVLVWILLWQCYQYRGYDLKLGLQARIYKKPDHFDVVCIGYSQNHRCYISKQFS